MWLLPNLLSKWTLGENIWVFNIIKNTEKINLQGLLKDPPFFKEEKTSDNIKQEELVAASWVSFGKISSCGFYVVHSGKDRE